MVVPSLKVTVPVGVDAVPVSVSVTVAVHDVLWPTAIVVGRQATLIVVARLVTVTVAEVVLVLVA